MMKKHALLTGLMLACLLLVASCGYYFPHVYEGPRRVIYMPSWKNRTNKLNLDMKIYQSLSRWFHKTQAVDLTKEKLGADYALSGEILAIDLPTISWNTNSDATGTKVKLFVRYSLKDLKSGKILWDENNKLYTADYTVQVANSAADDEALSKIIDDMSEIIFLGTLKQLRKQSVQTTP
ncbi:MAG: LPS assembly lipoprotein LptE [Desulfobulbus sp.]|nr:LPS assembly lipoprotein LptE [Desulfobulbus sp.]